MLLRRYVLAAAVIALAIACGVALAFLAPPGKHNAPLEWLHTPRPVAPFQLASHRGAFTEESLRGHWQLLLLGFTHCPDLCPATLSQLSALRAALPDHDVRVVFVSVDPARDTPQRLHEFVGYFSEGTIGITGPDPQLRELVHSLGMDFRREGAADTTVISHSPTIALVGPDGTLRGRLRAGFDAQQAAREIAAHLGPAS